MAMRTKQKKAPWAKVDVHQAPTSPTEIFIKFGLMSTVRGIPRIFKARNRFLSIFWATTVIAFLVVSFFQVYQIVDGFLGYNIKQEHNIKLSRSATFPDITVCSLQPFRSKKSLMSDKVKRADALINEYFFNVSKRITNQSYEDYIETEFQYKAGSVHWSRDNDHYYDDDEALLNLDWWGDADSEGGNDETPTYDSGDTAGWTVRNRRKRTPKINLANKREHLVDDETMRNILMTTTGLYQNIPRQLQQKLGHQKTIIDQCIYTVQTVKEKRLETVNCTIQVFHFPQYFNCYTISLGKGKGTVLEVVVNLFLDDDVSLEYPKHYTRDTDSQKHGVRVVIHDPYSYPDVRHDGHDVPPGMSANFILRTNMRKHLAAPYGTCYNDAAPIEDMHGNQFKYRRKTCEDQAIQRKINKDCHCIDPGKITDPVTSRNLSLPNGRLPYCMDIRFSKTTISSRLACMYDYNMNPPGPGLYKCPSRCKHYAYITTMDMAKWPHESFHLPLYETAQQDRNVSFPHLDKAIHKMKEAESNDTAEQLRETIETSVTDWLLKTHVFQRNFASLTVRRPTFEVNYIVDKPSIDAPTLMSRIGGIMSFWLGITFITIIEFVEVVYDAISLMLKNRKKRLRRKNPEVENSYEAERLGRENTERL
ncbi:FMRFamide-activated amiloride-sensitive sodium channel-like [Lineus longissimus]|uniref:FMRFamide-activated amiloride-sensitive sodium channel-like n=1 Tax=Lineus longissimus TaxID=88925 RepID=UPI00315D976B